MKPNVLKSPDAALCMAGAIAGGLFCGNVGAQELRPVIEESHQAHFRLATVAEGFSLPWSLDFLPDGRMIVSEWHGGLRIVDGDRTSSPIYTPSPLVAYENSRGEERVGGLLGVAAHPGFADNALVYFCYLEGSFESNATRIARARLAGDTLRDFEILYRGDDFAQETAHSGCRLVWEVDGTLIATFGDRRHRPDDAQRLGNMVGAIVRLNEDGTIPDDNPFAGRAGARGEIWAYGVRNVQGIARHPETGAYWFSEHGPLGGDEVNILRRGANYGWPIATYGIDYDGTTITENVQLPGVDGPVAYWRPSTAPSGLAFYTGTDFPQWRGDLFMGSLADRRLIRMELNGDRVLFQEMLLEELDMRIREVRMGPDGYLYILPDADPAALYRIEPAAE